jgi:hypothetical protein
MLMRFYIINMKNNCENNELFDLRGLRVSVLMIKNQDPVSARAIFRNSSLVFMEQNFGPHMLQ